MDNKGQNGKICLICGQWFLPSKYHPAQKICSDSECQHQRQLLNQKIWRKENPNYFVYKERETPWQKRRAEYLAKWKKEHKNYFKIYRLKRRLQEKNKS